MKILKTLLYILFLSFFFPLSSAIAFQSEVVPFEISPGDAFIVRVTGADTSIPDASLSGRILHFSRCGKDCFVAVGAVDMETLPGEYTIRLNVGEDMKDLSLSVKQTRFEALRVTLAEDKVSLSAKNMKRAEKEAEKLNALWQRASEKLWEGSFILPLENDTSTPFGARRIINQKKISIHKGLDIKGKEGDNVKASNRGMVVLAEELFFGGNTVVLDHGMGIYTVYMHLLAFNVKNGDIVLKGDIIGLVGSSGRANGPHLHFGVKVADINTNPVSFVNLNLH